MIGRTVAVWPPQESPNITFAYGPRRANVSVALQKVDAFTHFSVEQCSMSCFKGKGAFCAAHACADCFHCKQLEAMKC